MLLTVYLDFKMVYNREPKQKSIIIMLDTRRDIIAPDIQQGISIKLRLSSVVTLNGSCITFSSLWNYFIKSVEKRANEKKHVLMWCVYGSESNWKSANHGNLISCSKWTTIMLFYIRTCVTYTWCVLLCVRVWSGEKSKMAMHASHPYLFIDCITSF